MESYDPTASWAQPLRSAVLAFLDSLAAWGALWTLGRANARRMECQSKNDICRGCAQSNCEGPPTRLGSRHPLRLLCSLNWHDSGSLD
jgi:hypothetical protein